MGGIGWICCFSGWTGWIDSNHSLCNSRHRCQKNIEDFMKRLISLPGLLLGLVAGLVAGLILSHFIGWLLFGLAVIAVIAAVRMQRGRKIRKLAKA
jgi:uncharacterized membrane protein YccC